MNLFVIVLCLAAGGLIGFMGGVLGIGGGLIAIPALVLLMDMPQQLAQGTALIMVLPTIMMAVRKYNQQVRIDKRVAAAGAGRGRVHLVRRAVGAGHRLKQPAPELRRVPVLHRAVLCMADLARLEVDGGPRCRQGRAQGSEQERKQARRLRRRPPRLSSRRAAQLLGMLCGTLGGFFGVGGAVLAVPIITSVFRLPQTTAQALALSMVIPGSTIALITYTWAGQANWMVGAPLAVGSLAFVPVGVRLAYRLPERRLRACFALMLFATVALLAFEA